METVQLTELSSSAKNMNVKTQEAKKNTDLYMPEFSGTADHTW